MGMAASQARYIALTARKSNVEYEGQQINQARTALANQTANLFNQMMGMSVPTPPSTTDYTTIQYSFSDGVNNEVLSNYYQLGTADSEYNYVVTTYHNEKVFTGSKKKMSDPQIQTTFTHHYSYDPTSTNNNDTRNITKAWKNDDGTYTMQATDGSTSIYRPATEKELEQVQAINKGNGQYADTTAGITTTTSKFSDVKLAGTNIAGSNSLTANGTTFTKYRYDALDEKQKAAIDSMFAGTGAADEFFIDEDGNAIKVAEITVAEGAVATDPDVTFNIYNPQGAGIETGDYYTDGKTFVTQADLDKAVQTYNEYEALDKRGPNEINVITVTDDPTFSNYYAIGNCILTELNAADLAEEDTKAEIDQIIKDMQGENGDVTAAANLAACFDTDANGNLVYKGGLYKFTMNGKTYYTTKNDLDASAGTSIVDNDIDVQQEKLNYYSADYLDTRVEETQKALLETDGQGRFKTLKLENDSTTYTLNTETVTDEDAYNDAMNRYYYENAVYEKNISDINARTEIIQAQDRTLELRLEQLNTEQNALQNEMEAVKKVVDKHVELGFKTFGG